MKKSYSTMATLFALGAAAGLGALTATNASAQTTTAKTTTKTTASKLGLAPPITLTGTVGGTLMSNGFFMRANGETYRVMPLGKVDISNIRGGDRVRVFGRPAGLVISYANVRILSGNASDSPSDFQAGASTTIQSKRVSGKGKTTGDNTNPNNNDPNRVNPNRGTNPGGFGQVNGGINGGVNGGFVNGGFVNGGIVPGIVTPGVVTNGGVTNGVVIPNTTLNAVKQNNVPAGTTPATTAPGTTMAPK